MTGLVRRELGLLLEDRDLQRWSALLESKRGGEPDDPAADDRHVERLGHPLVTSRGRI